MTVPSKALSAPRSELAAAACALLLAAAAVPGGLIPLERAPALAAALLGAYGLARTMGLGAGAAALAGLGFGPAIGLGATDAGVAAAALLPWLFLACEQVAREPVGARVPLVALGLVQALIAALAPRELLVALLFAAGLRALALGGGRAPRALAALGLGTLAGAFAGLPAAGPRPVPLEPLDPGALGLVVLAVAGALAWRRAEARAASGARRRAGLVALALGIPLVLGLVSARGLELAPWRLLDPIAWDSLRTGGWGPAPLVLALGVAGLLAAGRADPGHGWLAPLALISAWVALGVPGVRELWPRLPGLGRADPAAMGVVAALALSLLAARAAEAAGLRPRTAGALSLLALLALAAWSGRSGPIAPALPLDPPDEVASYVLEARGRPRPGAPLLTGSVHPELPAERVHLGLQRAGGAAFAAELSLPLAAAGAQAGARRGFRFVHDAATAALDPGPWRLVLRFERAPAPGATSPGTVMGTRRAAVWVAPARSLQTLGIGLALFGTFALLLAPRRRAVVWASALLTLIQGALPAWLS